MEKFVDNVWFEIAGRHWLLTTEHPASSYGKPILIEIENERDQRHIGKPIGIDDYINLPTKLPARSLGLEIEGVDPTSLMRPYKGREIAEFCPYAGTVAAYLSQSNPDE